jgi:hypothetical protein
MPQTIKPNRSARYAEPMQRQPCAAAGMAFNFHKQAGTARA